MTEVTKTPEYKLSSFKLGHALVYPDRNLVIYQDNEFHLPKKCFDVLNVLLSQQGQSVKRETLLDKVWGEHLGSDELLNNAISKLRNAIGKEFASQKIIQTVPKVGYRLSIKPVPLRRSRFFGVTIAVIMAVLITVMVKQLFFSDTSKNRPATLVIKDDATITDLTKLAGTEYGPSYHPDGLSILFAKVHPGSTHSDLYLQDLQSGDVEKITFDELDEYYPTWNRSGDHIAYVRAQGPICKVMVMNMPTRKIYEAHDCSGKWPVSLGWSIDGKYLISSWKNTLQEPHQIYHIDWQASVVTPLIETKSQQGDYYPKYSPSGHLLAWLRHYEKRREIVIYNVNSGDEVIYPVDLSVQILEWSNTDDLLYLVSMINRQQYQLSSLNLQQADAVVEKMTMIDGISSSLSINPVNGDVVFDQYTARQQLLVVDLKNGKKDFSLESSFRDDSPIFSPSGQWLLFRSNRSGKEGLWMVDAIVPKKSKMLFETPLFIEGFTWSKDEKNIIYALKKEKYYQLYLYDIGLGRHSLLFDAAANTLLPTLGLSEGDIYYSQYLNGQISLMRYDVINAKSERLLENAFLARESADGEWLYFCQYKKTGLWRIKRNAQWSLENAELFLEDLVVANSGNWVVHENGVIYLSQQSDHFAIRNVDQGGNDLMQPIKMDVKLMQVEGNNFTYDEASGKLIVVTDDNYVGNIRRFALPPNS